MWWGRCSALSHRSYNGFHQTIPTLLVPHSAGVSSTVQPLVFPANINPLAALPVPSGSDMQARPTAEAGRTEFNAGELPEKFDLVWEAWNALEEDFYGDLPGASIIC